MMSDQPLDLSLLMSKINSIAHALQLRETTIDYVQVDRQSAYSPDHRVPCVLPSHFGEELASLTIAVPAVIESNIDRTEAILRDGLLPIGFQLIAKHSHEGMLYMYRFERAFSPGQIVEEVL